MSTMPTIPSAGVLAVALPAAYRAGEAIMAVYARDFEVDFKADASPLTAADRAAHEIICAALQATGWPVLSEESEQADYATRKTWTRYWLVDPLDGTKEFVKRNGDFTVNIALIESGCPVLGVVYLPAHDTCYFGVQGVGAFRIEPAATFQSLETETGEFSNRWKENAEFFQSLENFWADFPIVGKRCRALLPGPIGDGPLRVVASRSHQSAETAAFIAQLGQSTGRAIEPCARGSALKLCLVAAGDAHIYPRLGPTMEWDTAAAQAVVEAAGGRVIVYAEAAQRAFAAQGVRALFDLEPLRYNREELLNPWFVVVHPAMERIHE